MQGIRIGGIYSVWGKYEKALEFYTSALKIDRESGAYENIAIRLNSRCREIADRHKVLGFSKKRNQKNIKFQWLKKTNT